jgi:hypothetical protein
MKIQDIPQVGKLGLTVTWRGRNGLLRRILVTPKNPRTDKQLVVREQLSEQARRFDALTDAQQNAWNVAAAGYQSNSRLGQKGPLTGLQLFVRINCKLGLLGQDPVDAPPVAPQFPDLAPQGLVITNTAGVVAVKLTCVGGPGREHGAAGQSAAELRDSGLSQLPHHRHLPGGGCRCGGHYGAVRG